MADWEPEDRSIICSEHFMIDHTYDTKCELRTIKCGAVHVAMIQFEDDLDEPAALKVCRICLAMDRKMYHIRELKLDQMYEQITGLMATSEERLPQRVCWECAGRLNSACRFRNKALRSDSLLHDMMQSDTYIKIRDIKSINRKLNQLTSTLVHEIYEDDDFDLRIIELPSIKAQETPNITEVTPILRELLDPKSLTPINEVEIKAESDNETFFEDHFDDDDDKVLSEVCVEKKEKPKVKKKREKVAKKVKTPKKVGEEGDLDATIDKYKKNDVKPRRNKEEFDESLFTITPLTYDQQIKEILKRKESSNYSSAPYKCTICYRGFQIKERFTDHSLRHTEQYGAYECFICKARFKSNHSLRTHVTCQHTQEYSCKECPFTTRFRSVAKAHANWHAGTKYQCPHCDSQFDKITTYMGHIRIKHVSDFVCELCGYTFVSEKGVVFHKKKKHRVDKALTLEGPYCELCDVKFVSEEAHDRHLKLSSKHSSDHDPNRIRNDSQSKGAVRRLLPSEGDHEKPAPIYCEQCGVQLRNLRGYAQHFRRAHPDKNRRTKNPGMKTPLMCEQCGKIFQNPTYLKCHMWVHTGEKRYKCDRCAKNFSHKAGLDFHNMRFHSGSRPSYECPLCGKHFAFLNNRNRHMFIHSGLKPFKCDTCGKCFTTASQHRAHVEHVHLNKPWPKRVRQRNRAKQCDDVSLED